MEKIAIHETICWDFADQLNRTELTELKNSCDLLKED